MSEEIPLASEQDNLIERSIQIFILHTNKHFFGGACLFQNYISLRAFPANPTNLPSFFFRRDDLTSYLL